MVKKEVYFPRKQHEIIYSSRKYSTALLNTEVRQNLKC